MAINNEAHIHEVIAAANIFVRKDGKWLVLRRSPLKKYAPNVVHPYGGKVDANESPYETATREIKEEVGVEVTNMKLEAVVTEIEPVLGEPHNWLVFHFSADYDSGAIITTEEGEAVLLSEEELLAEKLFPSVREIITYIINPQDGTVFAKFSYSEDKTTIVDKEISVCSL